MVAMAADAPNAVFNGHLTSGGVARVYQGDTTGKPIVQVIDLKVIGTATTANNPGRRYRLIISDGVHFQQAMLATQLNTLVTEERLQNLGIIRMEEYVTQVIADKRYVEGGPTWWWACPGACGDWSVCGWVRRCACRALPLVEGPRHGCVLDASCGGMLTTHFCL